MVAASTLIGRFTEVIIDPAIFVLFTFGFFLFMWGLVQFLWNLQSGTHEEEGKKHMLWGMVGMLIMVSVYGIIALIDNTFSLNITNPDINRLNNITSPVNFFSN